MTRIEALEELAAKVEAGIAGYSAFHESCQILKGFHGRAFEAYSDGSLDAAKALHDAVLPGYTLSQLWQQRHPENGQHPNGKWSCLLFGIIDGRYTQSEAVLNCPARAWLLAILNALIEQEKDK